MRRFLLGYISRSGQWRVSSVEARTLADALERFVSAWGDTFEPRWIADDPGNIGLDSEEVFTVKALETPRWRVAGPFRV
jgi:hypothetical protein